MKRLRKRINNSVLFLLLLSSCSLMHAMSTVVYGINKSYAHEHLELQGFLHQIFDDPIVVDTCTVNTDGFFEFRFNAEHTQALSLNLGPYTIHFVLTPGDSVKIDLPPFKKLTKAEIYNPYFSAEEFHVVPNSGASKQVNAQIVDFEVFFDSLYRKAMYSLQRGESDSVLGSIYDTNFSAVSDSGYLNQYKKYTSASLFELVYPYSGTLLVERFFSSSEPKFNTHPFWNAFNKAFDNPLIIAGKNSLIPEFEVAVWNANYAGLLKRVSEYYGIKNKAMAELIVLKGIYKSWFILDDLHAMLSKLLQEAEGDCSHKSNAKIANRISENLLRLEPGSKAPYYELPDALGKKVPLTLKGRFVVLAFGSPELLQCKRDYLMLEEILKTYKNALEVVAVVVHQPFSEFVAFEAQYNGDIIFAHWNNNKQLLKDYNIKGLPAYYIINPKENLLVSPALTSPQQVVQALERLSN